MTSLTHADIPADLSRFERRAAAKAPLIKRLVAGLGALFTALQNRREVNRLLEVDPAMLRDIGLQPSDVHAALSEPLWSDPSARLLAWTAERRSAARSAARDNLEGLARRVAGKRGEDR